MPPTAAGVTQTPIATPCGHFAALRLVRSTFGLCGFPPSFALRRISRPSDALLDKRFSSKSGDGRKDKALTTMPSRLRDVIVVKPSFRIRSMKSFQVVAALAAAINNKIFSVTLKFCSMHSRKLHGIISTNQNKQSTHP